MQAPPLCRLLRRGGPRRSAGIGLPWQAPLDLDIRVAVAPLLLVDAAPVIVGDGDLVITHVTRQGADRPHPKHLAHVVVLGHCRLSLCHWYPFLYTPQTECRSAPV